MPTILPYRFPPACGFLLCGSLISAIAMNDRFEDSYCHHGLDEGSFPRS